MRTIAEYSKASSPDQSMGLMDEKAWGCRCGHGFPLWYADGTPSCSSEELMLRMSYEKSTFICRDQSIMRGGSSICGVPLDVFLLGKMTTSCLHDPYDDQGRMDFPLAAKCRRAQGLVISPMGQSVDLIGIIMTSKSHQLTRTVDLEAAIPFQIDSLQKMDFEMGINFSSGSSEDYRKNSAGRPLPTCNPLGITCYYWNSKRG